MSHASSRHPSRRGEPIIEEPRTTRKPEKKTDSTTDMINIDESRQMRLEEYSAETAKAADVANIKAVADSARSGFDVSGEQNPVELAEDKDIDKKSVFAGE